MYEVKFTPQAEDDLSSISKEIITGIRKKINRLAENADVIKHERLQAKRFKGLYSLHFGAYRIIYSLNKADQLIIIVRAGHHRDIYRK